MLVFITATAQGGTVKNIYKQLVTTALLATIILPGTLMAEATFDNSGTRPLSTTARLNFQIKIPGILRFRVGSTGSTIDTIEFSPTVANLGDGTDIDGTGGDLTGGEVTVDLFSNAGQVTITPLNNSSNAGLSNVDGDVISYDEILTATSNPDLPAPDLSDTGGTPTTPSLNGSSRVTNQSGIWTYTYDNTAEYPEGTYGGATRGGQVTYTASVP
jgi:hypothetical protein